MDRELLDLDIDTRLVEIWREAWEAKTWSADKIGALLRLAYGCGYCDALTEPRRGQLCLDHGFPVPQPKK